MQDNDIEMTVIWESIRSGYEGDYGFRGGRDYWRRCGGACYGRIGLS